MQLSEAQRRALELFRSRFNQSPDWIAQKMGYTGPRAYLAASNIIQALGDKGYIGQSVLTGMEPQPFDYVSRLGKYRLTTAGRAALEAQAPR